MATWQTPQIAASTISVLTDALQPVAEVVAAAVNPIIDVLNAVQPLITAAGDILAQDPLAGFFEAFAQELLNFVNDLANADVFLLPLLPSRLPGDLLRPYLSEQALADLSSSLSDGRDSNRPSHPTRGFTNDASFISLTIMGGANNWADFATFLRLMGRIFDGSELNKWASLADIRLKFDEFRRLPRDERNSQGVPWDWTKGNLQDLIPIFGEFMERVRQVLESVMGAARGLANAIRDLVNNLRERLLFIQDLVDSIQDILDFLRDITRLLGDVKILRADAQTGGPDGYALTLRNAAGRPELELAAGVALVAFGPQAPPSLFDSLQALLGIELDIVGAG